MWGFLFFRSSKKSSNQTGSCGGTFKKKSPTLKASHAKETSKLCCVNCSGTQSYDKMSEKYCWLWAHDASDRHKNAQAEKLRKRKPTTGDFYRKER